jgi:hypothetical protein
VYQNPDTMILIPVSINTPLGVDTDTKRTRQAGASPQIIFAPAAPAPRGLRSNNLGVEFDPLAG